MDSHHERLKYAATIGLGFLLDLSVAYIVSRWLGPPLELSAVIGFVLALAVNYLLLEFWVFPAREKVSFSLNRLVTTAGAAALALGVRISVIYLLGLFLGTSSFEDLLRLGAGFSASFMLNYLLARLIFKRR